jgi:thioredoxin-related protein
VQFVIIDLDQKRSPAQRGLVDKYYTGYIPHVVILNSSGKAVYNAAGEVEESKVIALLEKLLQ